VLLAALVHAEFPGKVIEQEEGESVGTRPTLVRVYFLPRLAPQRWSKVAWIE